MSGAGLLSLEYSGSPLERHRSETIPSAGFVRHMLFSVLKKKHVVDLVLEFVETGALTAVLLYPPEREAREQFPTRVRFCKGTGTFVDDVLRQAREARPTCETSLTVYGDDGLPWEDDYQTHTSLAVMPSHCAKVEREAQENLKKVCLLGDGGVGKSCILARYAFGYFKAGYEPTVSDLTSQKFKVDDRYTYMDILDTAGQEDFIALRSVWYRKQDFFILVCSITDPGSIEKLTEIYEDLCDHFDGQNEIMPGFVIAANKHDLKRRHRTDEGLIAELTSKTVDKWKATDSGKNAALLAKTRVMLTSAKTGFNITELFVEAVRRCREEEQKSKDVVAPAGCACATM